MASIAAKITDLGFRALMLRKLDSAEKFVAHSRMLINIVRPPARIPRGIDVQKTSLCADGQTPIPAVCVSPKNPTATVLYLHGGAFICGKFATYAGLCSQLAKGLNARVYWPDYRMAPEHPFPAATDDAFQSYLALCQQFPDQPIAIMGDSAGGNLTLSTLLRTRDVLAADKTASTLRMPCCAAGLSPNADLSSESPSRHANGSSDCILTPQIIQYARALYLDGHDPYDPYASPVLGDFTGLPPLMMTVSEAETMRDDVYRVAHKAKMAGLSAKIISRWDAPHAWPVLFHVLPEAREDIAEIIRFTAEHFSASAQQMDSHATPGLAQAS